MVIVGTGGLAKDLIVGLMADFKHLNLFFFNDRSDCPKGLFLDRFEIIRSYDELTKHFETNRNEFVVAIANPLQRLRITNKLVDIGGIPATAFSNKQCVISEFSKLGKGTIVISGAMIGSCVTMGDGNYFNAGSIIGHDAIIGNFVSFGPGCKILGKAEIGDYTFIGANAVILSGVKIGKKVRIGIGKIVSEDVPDNTKFI